MLKIYLLGGFLIEHDGRSLPPISSTAGRSLLAYLVTYRRRRHTRDLLAGTFWPDRAEASARKRLSQALWHIHTALKSAGADESIIEVAPNEVFVNAEDSSFWLDVEEFERLAGIEKTSSPRQDIQILEEAVGLYRGDFMAGYYHDWMLLERERLSDRYLHTLESLVTIHKARADYRSALSCARRVVLEDPVREAAHREIMRLNFLLGRSTEALQQFDRCEAILREELSVGPSERTKRLRDQIAQLRDKGDRPFVPGVDAPLIRDPRRLPLVGRVDERTAGVRRIEETLAGNGGITLVEGESGIGKTRLLKELVSDANWRGANVMWAQANPQTQIRPYHALGQALHGGITRLKAHQLAEILDQEVLFDITRVAPEVVHFFPDLPDAPALPPDEARRRLQTSMSKALLSLGELGAHVLFIDDAQWIDTETLEVVGALAAESSQVQLSIFLAYRSDEARDRPEVWEALRQLDERSHPERLILHRLSADLTTYLIEEVTGASVSRSFVEGVFHETGGNPLFILETLRTLHESADHVLESNIEERFNEIGSIARGVTQVIKRRLANLEPESRVVLNAAAILGSRFDTNLLTRMSRLAPAETLEGLSQLMQRGIIVETSGGYEFSHQQMQAVAQGMLKSPMRRRLHGEAAIALEAEHPDRIEELAHHYSSAKMAEPAMRLAWQAGSRAVALASYASASRYLEQALTWAEKSKAGRVEHFELLCDLENVLDVLASREHQIEVIGRMAEIALEDAELLAETWRRRANVLSELGSNSDALAAARTALAHAESADNTETLCAVERTFGTVFSRAGNSAEAVPHLENAVVRSVGRPTEEADTRKALGDVLAELQRYAPAEEQLRAALLLYEEEGDLRGVTDAKGLLAILQMEQGKVAEATELYGQALDLARRLGYRRAEAVNLVNRANLEYFVGQLSSALEDYALAAGAFQSIGDRRGSALARANLASVHLLVLGDHARADREARTALTFFESEGHDWGAALCLEILAGIAEHDNDMDGARSRLGRALERLRGTDHRWLEVHLHRHMAEIELALGDLDASRLHIDKASALCDELGLADVMASVESVVAQIALAGGDLDGAVRSARRATAQLSESAEQPYRVWYRAYLAEAGSGHHEEARAALTRAWKLLNDLLGDLPESQKEKALRDVPVNQAISFAFRKTWPVTVEVRLPRKGIPRGRRLAEDDFEQVCWTVSKPSDFAVGNRVERRRRQLSRLVKEASTQAASPRVSDLADALSVSEATLRRDLAWLRRGGDAVPTRGSRMPSG